MCPFLLIAVMPRIAHLFQALTGLLDVEEAKSTPDAVKIKQYERGINMVQKAVVKVGTSSVALPFGATCEYIPVKPDQCGHPECIVPSVNGKHVGEHIFPPPKPRR